MSESEDNNKGPKDNNEESTISIETWIKGDEKKEKTEWHRVVVFNAPLILRVIKPFVKKGTKLYLEGSLQTRKWQDNNNIERFVTEIVLQNFNSNIILLDAKGGSNSSDAMSENKSSYSPNNFVGEELDDDIPF